MDFKDSKTQKIALGVLAFFIVVYFWYSRVYSNYSNQLAQKTQEFESITTNLRNVEMKAKSLDALKIEYSDLVGRYHEIEALLPEVEQIPSFLVQLHTASSITGTRITKVNPMPIKDEKFYHIAPFEIEVTGTYNDFGQFISYVANFPFIANVSDVDIEALNVSKSAAVRTEQNMNKDLQDLTDKATIKATFTLSTYFVKENERLKELVL